MELLLLSECGNEGLAESTVAANKTRILADQIGLAACAIKHLDKFIELKNRLTTCQIIIITIIIIA